MAYLSKFTPEHETILRPIMGRLEKLRPNESIKLSHSSPERCQRVRFVLYSWLHYNNLKDLYRIRTETPVALRILRLDRSDPTIASGERPEERFVKDHLLDITDHDEAFSLIRDPDHNLTPEQAIATYEEWKRVQGL